MSKETIRKIPQTPKGELAWVVITGEGVENLSGQMQYKTDLILEPEGKNEEHDAFVKSIEDYWLSVKDTVPAYKKNPKKKPKSLGVYPCDPLLDEDGNVQKDEEDKTIYDPNGRRALRFKTATTFPDGTHKKVKTYNAKAKEVNLGDTRIGNGSIGRVAGAMDLYSTKVGEAGVTLYLDKIMISKLVEMDDNAFEADEDGEFVDVENDFTGEESEPAEGKAKPRL